MSAPMTPREIRIEQIFREANAKGRAGFIKSRLHGEQLLGIDPHLLVSRAERQGRVKDKPVTQPEL